MNEGVIPVSVGVFLLGLLAGWLSARVYGAANKGRQVDKLRRNYFRGLNFLLNEQPDKAIEVFLQIAEVDNHTVETHLALGSLFRRRGETDRAIRLHQNLISRPSLTADQKSVALLELGEDYMRAGLLDRAELLFTDLLNVDAFAAPSLRQLISVCQQERDWRRAIEHARRLQQIGGEAQGELIAHFLCELALEARNRGDLAEAAGLVAEAQSSDPLAVRPRMLAGDLAMARGDCTSAVAAFEQVLADDADYTPDVLPRLLDCLARLGREAEVPELLQRLAQRFPGISPVLELCRRIAAEQGAEPATQLLGERLRAHPSLRGLLALVELRVASATEAARPALLELAGLLKAQLVTQPLYRCGHCGFGARTLHWQCPSCKRWGTIKCVHGIEGE
ncbi:MAG: lipopolysaccharide assembly protein LapB [Lysobacterales bacterium]